jgi:hypothetical protein
MKHNSIYAMMLAFLVPGAGHLYLGKRGRALAFFLVVVLLFVIGIAVDGALYTPFHGGGGMLRLLASLGSVGTGIPYFIAAGTGPHGDVRSITYEYGSAFIITAGLMNLLLVLDVFDIAEGRKQ